MTSEPVQDADDIANAYHLRHIVGGPQRPSSLKRLQREMNMRAGVRGAPEQPPTKRERRIIEKERLRAKKGLPVVWNGEAKPGLMNWLWARFLRKNA